MKKVLPIIAIVLLLPFLISQKPPKNGEKPYVDGQVMVKLRSDMSPAQQQQIFQEFLADYSYLDLAPVQKLSNRLNIVLLSFTPDILADERVLEEIQAFPYVEMAQFNHFIEQREYIPSDQFFGLQWNMHNTGQTGGTADADIDAPEAWEIASSNITATGDEIVIANVDDGFDIDHEDLEFWKNTLEIPNNNIDDDTNGYVDDYDGWNSWSNSGVIIERDHGTHTTGIAAAQGDNDKGVAGVNLHVKVLPVVGSATVESIVVAAYGYLYEMRASYNESDGERGAFIVSNNCSFGVNMGQPEDYPIWGAMYDSLGMLGILSAGATANANWDIDEVGDIPTAFPSEWLITVTNTDEDDNKNSGAAYGLTTIDLGAPGTQIYSTRQGNQYGYKTGCSMSAPHIAGAIAYLFSVADEAWMQAYHNDPGGMALLLKQYILDGADPVSSLEGITVTGGRLNIYNAAQRMINPDLVLNPLSIYEMLQPDKQDTVPLQITNNTTAGFNYLVKKHPEVDWFSLGGLLNGFLNAGQTATIDVYFDTEGMQADTLYSYIIIEYGDGEQFLEPVHLVVDPFVAIENDGRTAGLYDAKNVTMEVWPNPAREGLRFKVLGLSSGINYKIGIYNSTGMQVLSRELKKDWDELKMDVSSLPRGIYLVTLMAEEKPVTTKKIIIN